MSKRNLFYCTLVVITLGSVLTIEGLARLVHLLIVR